MHTADRQTRRQRLAALILACGTRYGYDGIDKFFTPELRPLLRETLSELHKNNTPEEEFLFAVIRMFKRHPRKLPAILDIDLNVSIAEIHSDIKNDIEYLSDSRISSIDEFRQQSVLRDFTYYMSQLFFFRPELFEQVAAQIEST